MMTAGQQRRSIVYNMWYLMIKGSMPVAARLVAADSVREIAGLARLSQARASSESSTARARLKLGCFFGRGGRGNHLLLAT
jgi:hypothetical protein